MWPRGDLLSRAAILLLFHQADGVASEAAKNARKSPDRPVYSQKRNDIIWLLRCVDAEAPFGREGNGT
jgi:hypothetical protein